MVSTRSASGSRSDARRRRPFATALLVAGLTFSTDAGLAGQRDAPVHPSPVGVWLFSGGEAPRMRMIFSDDGRLRFEGGFEFYNPGSWELITSQPRSIVAISSPSFTPEALDVFESRADGDASTSAADSVDMIAGTVYYDLSESPCHILFAGWMFERQSRVCLRALGGESFEARDRREPRTAHAERKPADADTAERDATRPQPTMSADEAVARWIGTRHPPLPEDVVYRGGATVGIAGETRYTFRDIVADGRHMLWLERIVDRPADGSAVRVVLDALVVPELARTEGRRFVYGLCGTLPEDAPANPQSEDLEIDPEIVAIARFAKAPVLTAVDRAWRADRSDGTFVPLSTSGIGCLNETPAWAW